MPSDTISITPEQAEILALKILGWLAENPDEMEKFTTLAGITPADILQQADNADMLGGMMDFFLSDDTMLTRFCEEQNIDPFLPAQARRLLPGGQTPDWG